MNSKQSEQSDNIYTNIAIKVAEEIQRSSEVVSEKFTAKQPFLMVKGK